MKRILIITYYWPPSGGAGVQRWLKFVKYLSEFGYEVVVYTPEEGEFPSEDKSLFKDIPSNVEILKTPIWEPYDLYKKFVGQKKTEKVNAGFIQESKKPKKSQGLSVWVRGNLFIPDARKFWIKPSVKYLTNYLKNNPVDTVISSGPPHSMHMIALSLKNKLKTHAPKWIADFRDPWTNIDYYKDLKLSTWADNKHKRLEKKVLAKADQVITVGKTLTKELESLGAKNISTITNGYDAEDFTATPTAKLDEKLSIAHIGSMNKDRNPIHLWKYLSNRVKSEKNFAEQLEIKLIGKVDIAVLNTLESLQLKPYIKHINYLQHDQVIEEQQKSKILLLVVNNTPNAKGILTGKMFEYMAAKRPILMIGPPDGDAAEILSEGFGTCFDFENMNFDSFFSQDFKVWKSSANPEKYTRKVLTQKLVELF